MPSILDRFIEILKRKGFQGDIEQKLSERLMLATDNSIYEILPMLCLYPKQESDVILVATLLAQSEFKSIKITPRGGGTGTNGQSLNDGVMLDFSRHMNQIFEIDVENKTVRVQAGVVKDQLNKELKRYGLFFAPELSTSNRATIGGMINTDASGQGSCTYGKTRDHVIALRTVLLEGEILETRSLDREQLAQKLKDTLDRGIIFGKQTKEHDIYDDISRLIADQYAHIQAVFPKLNRCLTGYDLAHIWDDNFEHFNLNNIICGSEGTLGFVTEATLNCLAIPKYTALVNIGYGDFNDALMDAYPLMQSEFKPLSIEIVDEKVVALAKNDFIWESVKAFFKEDERLGAVSIKALNLIEFNADSESALRVMVDNFVTFLQQDQSARGRVTITIAEGRDAVNKVYGMRKRAVGLLGNVQGEARPIPFVEDTAVPPENLADYIREFRQLLDDNSLSYGMFGHADAGVLHVRPALDMKKSLDRGRIKIISDQVAVLCQKYGGVLWGEHGKGVRSGYAPLYFGDLYPLIQTIKSLFDPHYQLNPGKIATPQNVAADQLYQVDTTPMRGTQDEKINPQDWQNYQNAVHCNGNGACFNYDLDDAMCPSYKATRNRFYSPKGRAMLLKEWLRQKSDPTLTTEEKWQFTEEVNASLSDCLACKSCTGQCPIKVDVPEFRSQFLYEFHQRQKRSVRDRILAKSEHMAQWVQKLSFAPFIMQNKLVTQIMARCGLVDLPSAKASRLKQLIAQGCVKIAHQDALAQAFSPESTHKNPQQVIIIPDAFTQFFDPNVLCDTILLLDSLGIGVWLAPYLPSGKAMHVLGMRDQFVKTATHKINQLYALAAYKIPLLGIEPAVTLMVAAEYKQLESQAVFKNKTLPKVYLLQEWLVSAINENIINPNQVLVNRSNITDTAVKKLDKISYSLLSHCTEKTNFPSAPNLWRTLFEHFGLKLELVATGCCGMSGMFGHLKEKQALSRTIYDQSFHPVINAYKSAHIDQAHTAPQQILVTGYSCRTQIKRFDQLDMSHPVSILVKLVGDSSSK